MGPTAQFKPAVAHANEILGRKRARSDIGAARGEQRQRKCGSFDKLTARGRKCLHGGLQFAVNQPIIGQAQRKPSLLSVVYFEDIRFWAIRIKSTDNFPLS
jgi:hypothetical protein